MPELPEVQTTVNGLNKYVRGLIIKDVWTDFGSAFHEGKSNIKNPDYFKNFKRLVVGKKIIGASRQAKNILIELSDENIILIHLKMTGHILYGKYKNRKIDNKKIVWEPTEKGALQDPFNRFIHLVFTLSNGKHLALSDLRKFAKVIILTKKEIKSHKDLERLGPEPLAKNFSLKIFRQRLLSRPKAKIKTVLMDQNILAGIGNIYSDEILWHAGAHPESRPEKIPAQVWSKMFSAMKTVLTKSLSVGGDSMSDFRDILGRRGKFQKQHKAYRLTGSNCQKTDCGGIIKKIKVGGRSAHFCSKHQILY